MRGTGKQGGSATSVWRGESGQKMRAGKGGKGGRGVQGVQGGAGGAGARARSWFPSTARPASAYLTLSSHDHLPSGRHVCMSPPRPPPPPRYR